MGLKVLMAVSMDGYVARASEDDMRWTGEDDKKVFRLLTNVYLGEIAVGVDTFKQMPALKGRELRPISRVPRRIKGVLTETLEEFYSWSNSGWLIGGQKLALAAIEACMVEQVFLCHNRALLGGGIRLDTRLATFGSPVDRVEWFGVDVEIRHIDRAEWLGTDAEIRRG